MLANVGEFSAPVSVDQRSIQLSYGRITRPIAKNWREDVGKTYGRTCRNSTQKKGVVVPMLGCREFPFPNGG